MKLLRKINVWHQEITKNGTSKYSLSSSPYKNQTRGEFMHVKNLQKYFDLNSEPATVHISIIHLPHELCMFEKLITNILHRNKILQELLFLIYFISKTLSSFPQMCWSWYRDDFNSVKMWALWTKVAAFVTFYFLHYTSTNSSVWIIC